MSTMRVPPSTKEILARQALEAKQRLDAQKTAKPPSATGIAVAPAKPIAVPATAVPDNRTPQDRFLDILARAGIVGRLIRFTKDGVWMTADDEKPIDENAEFIVPADQTLVGF